MEYTQWEHMKGSKHYSGYVLILVVMEYTQWELDLIAQGMDIEVLILVVMEYTQWVQNTLTAKTFLVS